MDEQNLIPERRRSDELSSRYRCCCCGTRIKSTTLIILYVKLVLILLILFPAVFVANTIGVSWGTVALVVVACCTPLVLGIVSTHLDRPWFLLPYVIFYSLLTVAIVALLGYLIYGAISGAIVVTDFLTHVDVVGQILFPKLHTRNLSVVFFGLIIFVLVLLIVIEVWCLYVVWRCFFHLKRVVDLLLSANGQGAEAGLNLRDAATNTSVKHHYGSTTPGADDASGPGGAEGGDAKPETASLNADVRRQPPRGRIPVYKRI